MKKGRFSIPEIRLPARASIWYVGTNVSTKAVGMLLTPIFTRIMTGAEYGEHALYMSWLGLASTVALGAISQNVIYKGFVRYESERDGYTSAVLGAGAVAAVGAAVAVGCVGIPLGLTARLLPCFVLQLLFDAVINVALIKERYVYSYKRIALRSAAEAIVAPIISVVLIVNGAGGEGRIYGLLITAGIVAAVAAFGIIRRGGRIYDGEVWRFVFSRSAKLLPYLLSVAVLSQADKLIISRLYGTDVLGRYAVAHTVGMGLGFVVGGISSSLGPWIIRKLRAGNTDAVREIVGIVSRGICAVGCAVVAIAPEAIRFLAPSEYLEATYAVVPITLTALPSFIFNVASVSAIFKERDGGVSASAVPAAVASVVIGVLFSPRFLYTGAAIGLLGGYIAMAICSVILVFRCSLGRIFDVRKILFSYVLSSLFCIVIAACYHSLVLRILLLIPPALFLTDSAFAAYGKIIEVKT